MSTNPMSNSTIVAAVVRDVHNDWKDLAVTAVLYQIIAFVLLTPLAGLLFRVFLAASGRQVLTDADIAVFFLSPLGLTALVILGAVWLAIAVWEQAALMTVVAGEQRHCVRGVLWFVARRSAAVLNLTARVIVKVLAIAVPFLAAGGLIFFALLTDHDINFYLSEKPPRFLVAAGLIGSILAAMAVLLAQRLLGWAFSLPILLFEGTPPAQCLAVSRARTNGNKLTLAKWLIGWMIAATAVSSAATLVVAWLGGVLIPDTGESLARLSIAVGAVVVVWGALNLVITLLSACGLAVIGFHLYRAASAETAAIHVDLPAADPSGESALFRLSRGKILAACVIALLLAGVAGASALETVKFEDHTQVTAHRGASADSPENTMASVREAVAQGADWVEIDVQESSDGVVMVVHDSDLKKLAGVGSKIWEQTADELRAVDIGSKFDPRFAGERVPTLAEVLEFCKGKIRVNIELKYYGHDQQLEQRVVDLVEAAGMQDDVVIMSLKLEGVEKLKAIRPDWKAGLLVAVAVGDLTKLDVDFLAVNLKLATRALIRRAHDRGMEVYVWTVNDPVSMSTMLGRGADNLITDKPAKLRSVLAQREKLTAVQRLLLDLADRFGISHGENPGTERP